MVEYQLTYSARRRTLGLQVKQGKVFVRAPNFLSEQQIDEFVQSKSSWLNAKIKQTSAKRVDDFSFDNGQLIYVHGVKRTFSWSKAEQDKVILSDDNLHIHLSCPSNDIEKRTSQCRNLLETWCADFVEHRLLRFLPAQASLMGVEYHKVKIRRYKSRWGSCTSKGNLTFNCLLAMVPASVFDYVVIHELAHLEFLDHSTNFWSLVGKFHPNYQADKAWLKRYQNSLTF